MRRAARWIQRHRSRRHPGGFLAGARGTGSITESDKRWRFEVSFTARGRLRRHFSITKRGTSMPNPHRQERLGELIAVELSDLMRTRLKDPRIGFASITHVEVS